MRRTWQLQIPRCIVNTAPQKKNYCPQTRFMSVPLASRSPIFFHSLKQFTLDARFFAHSLDNIRDTNCRYCCI